MPQLSVKGHLGNSQHPQGPAARRATGPPQHDRSDMVQMVVENREGMDLRLSHGVDSAASWARIPCPGCLHTSGKQATSTNQKREPKNLLCFQKEPALCALTPNNQSWQPQHPAAHRYCGWTGWQASRLGLVFPCGRLCHLRGCCLQLLLLCCAAAGPSALRSG